MYEQQSIEPDQTRRKQLVWEIDRRPQEDAARPMIFDSGTHWCGTHLDTIARSAEARSNWLNPGDHPLLEPAHLGE
jgi:hypothetical protein